MEESHEDDQSSIHQSESTQEAAEDGPGKEYEIYTKNEELVDKLKLLNYEDGFLKLGVAYKPILKHYFVKSRNVGEQFFLFTSLAAWLIKKSGESSYSMPQEFDDPNSTIANIMAAAKSKGISIDFTAAKLKSGAGENVISILNALADAALVHVEFQWQRMIPPKEEDEDTAVDEQEDDDEDGELEEESTNFLEDDDDDNVIEIDLKAQGFVTESKNPLQGVLQSTIDSVTWKQEVERVAVQLKITLRQDAKDWRLHLEQMNSMHKTVEQKVGTVGPYLENMSKDIAKTLERISTREKSLNTQLSSMMSKFKRATDTRAELREKYKAASVGVSSRTETLDRISDDIEQLKQQIEEQGAKSSDGAPLVKIKQAVSKLEEELQTMNVQIGVLEQSILNTYLRDHFNFSANLLNIM